MLWLSPELLASFVDLQVDHTRFADHSVMVATFMTGPEFAKRYLWPTPKPVPWPKVPSLSEPFDFAEGSPTEVFAQLWPKRDLPSKLWGMLGSHK